MIFLILIPLALIFKIILWGIIIAVAYEARYYILGIFVCSILALIYFANQDNNSVPQDNYPYGNTTQYIEPKKPKRNYENERKGTYQNIVKTHKNVLNISSLSIVDILDQTGNHKYYKLFISLKNNSKKTIVECNGIITIWDKNNEVVGDYPITNCDYSDSSWSFYKSVKRKGYWVTVENNEKYIHPNEVFSFLTKTNEEKLPKMYLFNYSDKKEIIEYNFLDGYSRKITGFKYTYGFGKIKFKYD